MPGPPPKTTRRRRNTPARGDWQPAVGVGWQHGPIPDPPDGLVAASRVAWETWMQSWQAAKWEPAALPVLRQMIGLYDLIERGQGKAADRSELRQLLESYGLTPKGAASLRWAPPEEPAEPETPVTATGGRYGHLRAVGEG